MPKRNGHKLTDDELLRCLDSGTTQTELARELGCSRQALHSRLKRIRGVTTKAILAKGVSEIVNRKLNAFEQLEKINSYANELLDLLMKRTGDGKYPRELALKVMAEIRGQLDLQLQHFKAAFSVAEAEHFMKICLQVIGEESPDAKRKIIERLNRERSVFEALRFTDGIIS